MPKHYKAWQQCLIWTLVIFLCLFVIARVDITVGIMCSIFTAYILSGKADIKDMYIDSALKICCENKEELAEEFERLRLFKCRDFVLTLNED